MQLRHRSLRRNEKLTRAGRSLWNFSFSHVLESGEGAGDGSAGFVLFEVGGSFRGTGCEISNRCFSQSEGP